MSGYKPPYTLTSKMINLVSKISEEMTKIGVDKEQIITPQLRKINRIKTLAGTLEIEENFLGEEKITAILEGKRVFGSYKEILESIESSVKSSVNMEDKILKLIKENSKISIVQIAKILELTPRAIQKQISKLKKDVRLKRGASAKKGEWVAIVDTTK